MHSILELCRLRSQIYNRLDELGQHIFATGAFGGIMLFFQRLHGAMPNRLHQRRVRGSPMNGLRGQADGKSQRTFIRLGKSQKNAGASSSCSLNS